MHIQDGNAQERAKYAEIWSLEQYREAHSPGLENVERFMELVQPKAGESLYDIGCGSGCAGIKFAESGLRVTYVDITDAGLDPKVPRDSFIEAPLWNEWYPERYSYGFCCDVLEHIPPEYTMLVIDRILTSCDIAWLQICNLPDVFGKLIGEPLHLTVQPYFWWQVRIATLGTIIDSRDLCGNSLFVVKSRGT